jgi:hypothetical protein
MRWVANRDERRLAKNSEYKKPKEYLDPLWYLIVILLFGNGAIDFAAFQFATMTILAPLASVSIVLNSVVAYFLLGEKFTFLHGVGSCIMICGATLTVITGPPEAEHQVTVYTVWEFFTRDEYLGFLGGKAILLGLCMVYINFVPVLELEKHLTKKAAAEKEIQRQELEANNSVENPTSNIVTIHEENEVIPEPMKNDEPMKINDEPMKNDELTVQTSHTREDSIPKSPSPNDTESRSRQNSSPQKEDDRLVRAQCQCPSTPRDSAAQPTTPTKPLPGGADVLAINRPLWQRVLFTQGHVVVWSFLVSGVGSYTNLTGKIFVKLIAASSDGNMQFTHWAAYLMAVLLIISAVTQLHLMKICLARFESIVIMPSLNCMYILHLMCEGGMFFNEFGHFSSELYKGLFALSIIIAFIGIAVASAVKEHTIDAKPEKGSLATELDILVSTKSSPSPIPVQ